MADKRASHIVIALIVDALLVAAFYTVGYYTHHKVLDFEHIAVQGWPFLAALGLAWVLNAAWTDPLAPLRTGVGVFATTVLLGIIGKILLGESTPAGFIIVTAGLNFLTLVGWRVIARAVAAKPRRR